MSEFSARMFSDYYESLPLPIYVLDFNDNTKILYVNAAWRKFSGYTKTDLKKLNAKNLYSVNDLKKIYKNDNIEPGKKSEICFLIKNGDERYVNCKINVTSISGEKWIVVAVEDLSQKIENAKIVSELQLRYDFAFQMSPDAISLSSAKDGSYVAVNEGFTNITGFTLEDVKGKNSEQVGIWADNKDRQYFLELLKQNGEVINQEFNFRWKDGTVRATILNSKIIHINNKSYILAIARDIQKQKKSNQLINDYEQLRIETEKIAKIGSWEFDPNTKEGTWTDEVARIHEVDPDKDTNVDFGISFFEGEYRDIISKAVEDAVEKGKPYDLILQLSTAKKNKKWVRTIGQPVYNEDKIILIRGIIQDISEQKKVEELILKYEHLRIETEKIAKIGSWEFNPATNEGTWTDGVAQIHEVNPKIATSVEFGTNFFEGEYRNIISKAVEEAVEKGKPYDLILQLTTAKKNKKWVRTIGQPVYNEDKISCIRGIIQDISEQKKAEELLVESEFKFRILTEKSLVGIYILQDGLFKYVNPKSLEIFEFENENEIINKLRPEDLVFEEDWPIVQKNIERRVKGEIDSINYGFRIITKSGKIKSVETFGSVIQYKGRPALIGSFLDITERLKIENDLEESRESYKQLVENLNDTIYSANYKGIITFINSSVSTILGYKPQEIINHKFTDFFHPEDIDKVKKRFENLNLAPHKANEYRLVAKDGTVRYVQFSNRPIYSNNKIIGLNGVMTDVTEQRLAQKALNESKKLFETLTELSPVGIFQLNVDESIVYANPFWSKITGVAAKDINKINWLDRVHPEDQKVLEEGFASDKIKNETLNAEFRIIAGKKIKYIYGQITPIKDSEGNLTGYLSTITDLTNQKHLENQLLQAQKMESIGHLAGGIAHDFNNLLTVINGYSELLLSVTDKESRIFENIAQINKAGKRAEGLTRQLLAFSRKQILQPVVLNLNSLIQEMEKMLNRIIGEDILLETHFEKGLMNIKADPGQIEQVIMNLAVNARDAMPQGGSLVIETSNVFLDSEYAKQHPDAIMGNHVCIAVSDTGIGMSKEVQEKIFDPFFSTKKQGKGTGLGLSTVYGIVKQSEGNIYVYSEPEKGTTFKIYLKSVEDSAFNQKREVLDEKKLQGKETILVVEDEDAVKMLITNGLKKFNYNILSASDANEGIKISREYKGQIDLLLTDVIMPGKGGKILADILKKERPETTVLFMSGYTDNAIVHHGVLDSGVELIQKPFTVHSLLVRIRNLLGKKQK